MSRQTTNTKIKNIKQINTSTDTEYRNCFDVDKGRCVYAKFNSFGNPYCSIDKIIQIEFYGCIPKDAKRLKKYKDKISGL